MSADLEKKLHRTIADVTNGIETLSLHTAIAKMIELNNELTKGSGGAPRKAIETLVILLSPFAPHLAEELWCRGLGWYAPTLDDIDRWLERVLPPPAAQGGLPTPPA